MLFNNSFLYTWGDIFGLTGEILQTKYFQYFDRSKTRHDRAKIGLAGQHDRPPFENYFEPCLGHYLFLEAHSFPRAALSEQIMSADKYPSIFSPQMETIVYIYPNFQNCARRVKEIKDNKHDSLHLGRKYLTIILRNRAGYRLILSHGLVG